MKKAILIISSFVFLERTNAQDTTRIKADTAIVNYQDSLKEFEAELDSLLHPRKSYIKFEIGFLSNNVYYGRKDSVATPYITPEIGYYHKSGLYANVLASYLPTPGQQRFDLFAIEAGYNHKFGNLEMQISGNKFFYDSNSYNVESEIKEIIAAAFSYDWDVITPVLTGTMIFSGYTDYAASLGLEHSIYAFKDRLEITPSFVVNASTQNYYNQYYKFRKYAITRFKVPLNYTILADVIDPSQFKILDYEFSMPFIYSAKRFMINFTPVFAIPVNPADLHVTRKINNVILKEKDHYEKIANSFFFQCSVSYKF